MTNEETYWMAGLLEGEGCVFVDRSRRPRLYPRVQLRMTDEDVIARAAEILGCSYDESRAPSMGARKPVYRLALIGVRAVDLMQAVYPILGERRRARIDEVLAECPSYLGVAA